MAKKEDSLIFLGNKDIGAKGLMNASGALNIKISDWSKDENAFQDIIKAMSMMQEASIYGKYTLVLSNSRYIDLQRLQGNTGMTEYSRIEKMLENVYTSSLIPKGQAGFINMSRFPIYGFIYRYRR